MSNEINKDNESNSGVITSGAKGSAASKSKKQAISPVANGVIGTGLVEITPKAAPEKPSKAAEEKVAVFSTKNVSWPQNGKVFKGYNILTKQQAEAWLTRDHVRLATPEEISKEFDV